MKYQFSIPFLLYSELLQHSCGPETANCGHQCKMVQSVPSLEGCDHQMGNWQPVAGILPRRMNVLNTCSTTFIAISIFYATVNLLIRTNPKPNTNSTSINYNFIQLTKIIIERIVLLDFIHHLVSQEQTELRN
jgi:hypothetical protein